MTGFQFRLPRKGVVCRSGKLPLKARHVGAAGRARTSRGTGLIKWIRACFLGNFTAKDRREFTCFLLKFFQYLFPSSDEFPLDASFFGKLAQNLGREGTFYLM